MRSLFLRQNKVKLHSQNNLGLGIFSFLFFFLAQLGFSSPQKEAEFYRPPPPPPAPPVFTDLPEPEPLPPILPPRAFPWTQLQAEEGETNGQISSYETRYRTIGSEASARQYVSLLSAGDFVSWILPVDSNSLVLRFSLPDSLEGHGLTGRLELYRNNEFVQHLDFSSAHSWVYGAFPWSNDPAEGSPHKFWDEINTLTEPFMAGDRIELRRPQQELMDPIFVDMIDVEWVAPPLEQPQGSLSVRDFGALGNGLDDDTEAFRATLEAALSGNNSVYLPPGDYVIGVLEIIDSVDIQGAGMWYSRLLGSRSRIQFKGGSGHFSDFAIFGDTDHRDDNSSRDLAFGGYPGPGTTLERIWVEHKKCAFWVGQGGLVEPVRELLIVECRFRNLMADAVNFCNGTRNSTVDSTHVRYSGDDGLATWSAPGDPPTRFNTFSNNWVQIPWLANGIALYGGESHTIQGNLIEDNIHTGSGIYVAANFGAAAFQGTVHIKDNTLVRSGTALSDQGGSAGALRILGWDKDLSGAWIIAQNIVIIDAVATGITIQGPKLTQNLVFRNIEIQSSELWAVEVKGSARGGGSFENVIALDSRGFKESSPNQFQLIRLGGNEGW